MGGGGVSGTPCPCGYKPRSVQDLSRHWWRTHGLKAQLAGLVAAQNCLCFWCKLPFGLSRHDSHPLRPTIEHLIPKAHGGGGGADGNLRAAHAICNNLRGSMSEAEWRAIIEVAVASLPEPERLRA